jgi:hypothetical protein
MVLLMTAALAAYLAVGIALVSIGPIAHLRRCEQEKLSRQHPRWGIIVFLFRLIVFWPLLMASAIRVHRCLSDLQTRYSVSLPFEVYLEARGKISWSDHEHFHTRLSQLGYLITGFTKGDDYAVTVPVVVKLWSPIALTRIRSNGVSLPPPRIVAAKAGEGSFKETWDHMADRSALRASFLLPLQAGDEIWHFSSSPDSWARMAGRAGLALVRDRTVVEVVVTMMN